MSFLIYKIQITTEPISQGWCLDLMKSCIKLAAQCLAQSKHSENTSSLSSLFLFYKETPPFFLSDLVS